MKEQIPYKIIKGTVNAFSYIDDTWLAPYCGWDVTVYRYRGHVDIEFHTESGDSWRQHDIVSDTWKKCITPINKNKAA